MISLLKYLKNYKIESFLAPLFKMTEALFELFVPIIVASIIDVGIANKDTKYIINSSLLLCLFAFVGMLVSITAQYFAAKAATGFSKELKHSLFDKIQKLSFSQLDEIGTSSLITRLTSDVNQIQNGINLFLRLFLRSPFIVFGAMIMAFTVNVKSALVFAVIIPVLSVVIFSITLYTIPNNKKVQKKLDNLTLKTRENLTGTRVVRAFVNEENEVKDFNEENEMLTKFQKKVGKITSLMNPLTYLIINIGIVLVVYVSAKEVNSGIILQGSVVALYNYMSQILIELIKLANLIVSITKMFPCASRVKEVLDFKEEKNKNSNTTPKENSNVAVEFKNVSFKYDKANENSLSDISFKINKGEKVGIIGSMGCGKTTLLSLIPNFYNATSGQVLVNNKNVKNYGSEELKNKIGFVLQKAVLFNSTVKKNLLWGKKDATDEEIVDALKLSDVYDDIQEKLAPF